MRFELFLPDEQSTLSISQRLGRSIIRTKSGGVVYLTGTLGAGKTTFCRGVISVFGHSGPVKSPTYTLVEPYEFSVMPVYHFDLYRLGDPEELEFLGIRDYFDNINLALIEWPNKGAGMIPSADLVVDLKVIEKGRQLTINAATELGVHVLSSLQE